MGLERENCLLSMQTCRLTNPRKAMTQGQGRLGERPVTVQEELWDVLMGILTPSVRGQARGL